MQAALRELVTANRILTDATAHQGWLSPHGGPHAAPRCRTMLAGERPAQWGRITISWKAAGRDFADGLMGVSMRAVGCDHVLTLDKGAARAPTHQLLA